MASHRFRLIGKSRLCPVPRSQTLGVSCLADLSNVEHVTRRIKDFAPACAPENTADALAAITQFAAFAVTREVKRLGGATPILTAALLATFSGAAAGLQGQMEMHRGSGFDK